MNKSAKNNKHTNKEMKEPQVTWNMMSKLKDEDSGRLYSNR